MKILFTTHTYYPAKDGVSIVVQYLAKGLNKLGHEVTVVTTWKKGLKREEIVDNIHIYRFDIYFIKFIGYKGEIDNYIDFVKQFNCDIIINENSQCVTTDLLLPLLNQIKANKILHVHGFSGLKIKKLFAISSGKLKNKLGHFYNYFRMKKYYGKFYEYLPYYDKILCLSNADSGKEYIETHTNKKVEILENAAEEKFFSDNKDRNIVNKYLINKNNNYIISVANYIPVKNQEMILKMFYQSNFKNCELILIGSQKTYYYDRIINMNKKLQKKYGNKNVNIYTNVNREDTITLIASAKVYVVSSKSEEYSVSIIEAMASKVPFVSTNVGNSAILPGGVVVDTISQMGNAIKKMLDDEKYRESLGKEGFEYASTHCRTEKAAKQLEEYCKSLVK